MDLSLSVKSMCADNWYYFKSSVSPFSLGEDFFLQQRNHQTRRRRAEVLLYHANQQQYL